MKDGKWKMTHDKLDSLGAVEAIARFS